VLIVGATTRVESEIEKMRLRALTPQKVMVGRLDSPRRARHRLGRSLGRDHGGGKKKPQTKRPKISVPDFFQIRTFAEESTRTPLGTFEAGPVVRRSRADLSLLSPNAHN